MSFKIRDAWTVMIWFPGTRNIGSASCIPAADSVLLLSHLPGEDGEIFVVKAGPEFKRIAINKMGERLMATPAISDGILYVRAENHLFAIQKGE